LHERRRIAVVAALALVSVGVAAVALLGGRGRDEARPTTGPSAPVVGGAPAGDRPPVVVRDFVFETANVTSPTAQKAQSKLWYAEGSWWGGLLSPVTEEIHIFRLDWPTQTWVDTGTVVDERSDADPDYLWDGEHLVVASAGTHSNAESGARILRFHFDTKLGRFVLDPDFPVPLTTTGINAIVVARDGAGALWVTYVSDGQVMVAHTLGEDVRWSKPIPLPGSGAVRPEDISSVIAFGPGRIGVMWSDQETQRMLFTAHEDGAPDSAWSPVEVVTEGAGSSDNHLNLKTFEQDGVRIVAAAVKTSLDTVTDPNPLAPQILVVFRRPDGHWDSVEAGRVEDHQSRPIILVDEERRILYLATQSPFKGGTVYLKRAALDDPVFDTGLGDPLIASEKDLAIANATSTKQSISRETGFVVMASDDGTGRFLHAAIDLGGTPLPAEVAGMVRPDTPDVPDIGARSLLHDDFDPWPVGGTADNGWTNAVTGGTVAIAKDGATRSLRLSSAKAADVAATCKQLAGAGPGVVRLETRFRLTATGAGDARLLTLRIPGGEIVGLRADAQGRFSYFDGTKRVRTPLSLVDGRWYRARLAVDVAKRRTNLRIMASNGDALLTRTGVRWRTDTAGEPSRVCFRAAGAQARLDVDSIVATR